MSLNEGFQDFTDGLTRINFEITNNCNKNCFYCLRNFGVDKNRKIRYMKIEDYKYVVSCISKEDLKNFKKVVITGGETLLHPKLIEIIRLIKKDFPNAKINVQTNGRLITRLPQKKSRVLPNIKNLSFSVSHYPGWNDEIRERYDGHNKLPFFYRRIIRKLLRYNRFIKKFQMDYRFPALKQIRGFFEDPLKRGNVIFSEFDGFANPHIDPKLSEKTAKAVRSVCIYHNHVVGRRLYNCCISEIYELKYNIDSVGIKFDKNWKRNFFKLPTWKACAHCYYGYCNYKFIDMETELGYKKQKLIDFGTRREVMRNKGHE